jgi:acyl dehydratase
MNKTVVSETLFFDDVEIGNLWRSPERTIQQSDVLEFAALTGDDNPLHVDPEFARRTPFQRPIAHGLLGMSIVAGLGSRSPSMHTAAFTRILEWRFVKPIYIGDTVHVVTEVVDKRASGRRRGLITWRRQLVNQDNVVVQEGTAETLVLMQTTAARVLPR